MLNLFKKKNITDKEDNPLIKIAALLIHAAKIDENYTEREKEIIKKTINELSSQKDNSSKIILKAEEIEKKSNQILSFTREVKNLDENTKVKIIEVLWKIIYSDSNPDMYENNLMRRLTGLLYIDPKIVGDIKEKVKKKLI